MKGHLGVDNPLLTFLSISWRSSWFLHKKSFRSKPGYFPIVIDLGLVHPLSYLTSGIEMGEGWQYS